MAVLERDTKEKANVGGVYLDCKISRLAPDQLWSHRTHLGIQWWDVLQASKCPEEDVQPASCRKHPDGNTLPLEWDRTMFNLIVMGEHV